MKRNRNRRISFLIAALLFAALALCLASCSGQRAGARVTFELNYDSAPVARTVEASEDGTVEAPEDPSREGYVFIGWYSDKGGAAPFDFDVPVSGDTTVFAGWISHADYLDLAAAGVTVGFTAGDNSASVTGDVSLARETLGVEVQWHSDNEDVVSAVGHVTRPDSDVRVTLTAEMRLGGESRTKTFEIVVKREKDASSEPAPTLTIEDLEELNSDSGYELELRFDEASGAVTSVFGCFYGGSIESREDALRALEGMGDLLGLDPDCVLEASCGVIDRFGSTYTFVQVMEGMEVYGRSAAVTADENGTAVSLNSSLIPRDAVDMTVNVSEEEIRERLETEEKGGAAEIKPVIFSLNEYENDPIVAYMVTFDTEVVFLSAIDGEIIYDFPTVCDTGASSGSGISETGENVSFPVANVGGRYYMMDASRNITVYSGGFADSQRVSGTDNSWNDPTAVSAYTNAITVYDWWLGNIGRRSVDDDGMPLKVAVHCPGGYDNAAWYNYEHVIRFFDNHYVTAATTSAAGLDIMGHEYTHGVFQFVTGLLPYRDATGAINEAYGDIFGCFVDGNWIMGEDWQVARNAADPNSTMQPDRLYGEYYVDYTRDERDNGGVHTNSTIITHAAYLMSRYGITNDKLYALWYLSVRQGYSADSDFYDVRNNVVKAAKQLKFTESELGIVCRAFDEVNIKDLTPVEDFTIPDELVVTLGEIGLIEPVIVPEEATNYTIRWTSSDDSVATVSPTGEAGIVNAVAKGTITVTAELTSGGRTITKTTRLRVASKARDTVLVLDRSGSMFGEPLREMKKAAIRFCRELLTDEARNRVGLVFYDDMVISYDLTDDIDSLIEIIENISTGGSTNMEEALEEADAILQSQSREGAVRNVVIMADGLPNMGAWSESGSMPAGDYDPFYFEFDVMYASAVIDAAQDMMTRYRLYSLGFFHSMDDETKEFASTLMRELTNQEDGYHDVDKAEELQFAFGDISDDISVGSKIVINIACPVDVRVTFDGETLSSAPDSYCDATSFGTLLLLGKDRDIKVLSLDSGKNYEVELRGTDEGRMDYSVNYYDDLEQLVDSRSFEAVPITAKTVITSGTDTSGGDVELVIDSDGDGETDAVWSAPESGRGEITFEKEPEEPSEPEVPEQPSESEEDGDIPAWAIAVIVAVVAAVIAGIAIGIAMSSSPKNSPPAAQPPVNAYAAMVERRPQEIARKSEGIIRIASGSMSGFEVPIKDGETIRIGKSADYAHIVLSTDYRAVSRRHCSVTFDAGAGRFYVTDHSTNGTHLMTGGRLEQGRRTPVKAGTVLYLGDRHCAVYLGLRDG